MSEAPKTAKTFHVGGQLEEDGPVIAMCERAAMNASDVIVGPEGDDVAETIMTAMEDGTMCKYCHTIIEAQSRGFNEGFRAAQMQAIQLGAESISKGEMDGKRQVHQSRECSLAVENTNVNKNTGMRNGNEVFTQL